MIKRIKVLKNYQIISKKKKKNDPKNESFKVASISQETNLFVYELEQKKKKKMHLSMIN